MQRRRKPSRRTKAVACRESNYICIMSIRFKYSRRLSRWTSCCVLKWTLHSPVPGGPSVLVRARTITAVQRFTATRASFRRGLESISRPVTSGLLCTDDTVNSILKRILETTSGGGCWRSVSRNRFRPLVNFTCVESRTERVRFRGDEDEGHFNIFII